MFQGKHTCFEMASTNRFESMFETGYKLIRISNGCLSGCLSFTDCNILIGPTRNNQWRPCII